MSLTRITGIGIAVLIATLIGRFIADPQNRKFFNDDDSPAAVQSAMNHCENQCARLGMKFVGMSIDSMFDRFPNSSTHHLCQCAVVPKP